MHGEFERVAPVIIVREDGKASVQRELEGDFSGEGCFPRAEAREAEQRILGGETVVAKRGWRSAGGPASGVFPGYGASLFRRTAHGMAPQPARCPRTRALSSSCPNGAPHGQISGLLRASSSRRRPSCSEFRVYISQNRQADQESPHGAAPSEQLRPSHDRLTGSAAANSPARRVAREFMPNTEPAARGR